MNIKFLVGQDHSIRKTAKLSGHARNTVRSVIRPAGDGARQEKRGRKSKLTDFKEYLRSRYLATGLSGTRLCAEITAMGFSGSMSAVRRFLQTIEKTEIAPQATVSSSSSLTCVAVKARPIGSLPTLGGGTRLTDAGFLSIKPRCLRCS